jgi:hypothetical protein
MNRSRTVLIALAVLVTAISGLATEYAFMGFDSSNQTMTAYVRSDQGTFHANVYMDQSNSGGAIGWYEGYADDVTEYYCDAPLAPVDPTRAFTVPNGAENTITATIDILDADGQPTGESIQVQDVLVAHVDPSLPSGGYYTYRNGTCTPVLPDTIRINSAFCATLCHGTYSIPIQCEYPGYDPNSVQVTVTNGCAPTQTHCNDDQCQRVDTALFTYRVRVFNTNPCRIFLVLTYCSNTPGCVCIWRSDFILPVEMAGFDAVAGDREVNLNWSTASELNTRQFVISRATSPDAVFAEVYRGQAAGTSSSTNNYAWTDHGVVNGVTYYYKLNWVDADGNHVYNEAGIAVVKSAMPQSGIIGSYSLAQNFPNPFNSQTNFTFSILNSERVSLKVFDLLGREVATLIDRNMDAGVHAVNWNADGLASGIYLYTLKAGSFNETKKLVYMK